MRNARSTEVDSLGVINLIGANLNDRYSASSILKELIQNADDPGAERVVVGWSHELPGQPKHELLCGPALFIMNDAPFTADDAHAICRFGQNYKFGEKAVIGKFGLGLKSVFHLCEAFFYLSSTKPANSDEENLFNNLASPWVNTEYHRGWNSVEDSDFGLLRDYLKPIWNELGSNWFSLWLPLRQQKYSKKVSFSGHKYGDIRNECPHELAAALSLKGITRALPLLNSVKSIQVWTHWGADESSPSAEVQLGNQGGRSLFAKYVNHLEAANDQNDAPISFDKLFTEAERQALGQLTIAGPNGTTTRLYAIVQSWCTGLMSLTQKPDWPKSFVLGGGQQPDKAQPHAAVVLARRIGHPVGGLNVSLAVFLPLENSRDGMSSIDQDSEYQLTLHGCFFVDSGRRHAIHTGDDIRGHWNRQLWTKGVLPLIVQAIDKLATSMADDSTAIRMMTECLVGAKRDSSDEQTIYEENRAAVCQFGEWLLRWTSIGGKWQLVERRDGIQLLEIPDFGTEPGLPGLAIPRLSELAEEVILTPHGWPRLTANNPLPWSDERLGYVLTIDDPQPLFEDNGAGLDYLLRFLKDSMPSGTAAITALDQSLRTIFKGVGSRTLRNNTDTLKRIVNYVPRENRLGLPLPANWPDDIRQMVCGNKENVLIVPKEFEPEDAGGTARLTLVEAVALLELMSQHISRTKNCAPARAVLQSVTDRKALLEHTCRISLWQVDRISAEKVTSETLSLADIREAQRSKLAVAGRPTDEAKELAAALSGSTLLVVPYELAVELFPEQMLPHCDPQGLLGALELAPPLASPQLRAPLLRRLLTFRPPPALNDLWRTGTRYLLHGANDFPAGTTLFLGGYEAGVWSRLTRAALEKLGEPGRVLSSNVLTESLNEQNLLDLGIRRLTPVGVGQLLEEVGPENIDLEFTSSERDEVLQRLQNNPSVIAGLPLHDAADGSGMLRIGANCYWESPRFMPGASLAPHVRLLRLSQNNVLAAIQRLANAAQFDEHEAIACILQLGPADHWQELLTALKSAGTLSKKLSDQLAVVYWLPQTGGNPVAPCDVLHDDAFGEEAASALRVALLSARDLVPSVNLVLEVQRHPGFKELARQLFPDRKKVLGRLAVILSKDDRFRVGNLDLRSAGHLNDWLVAFQDSPSDVMAIRELIGSVVKADKDLCISHFLPALRDNDVPLDRLEQILKFLRERHAQENDSVRQQTLRIFHDYLRLAANDRNTFREILPRLRLLNMVGEWADPVELCAGTTGLDPSQTLHSDQESILRSVIATQPTRQLRAVPSNVDRQPLMNHYVAEWHVSAHRLVKYFDSWRELDELVAEWVGAFVAILGDFEPIRKLASDCLRDRMSPEAVRASTGIDRRERTDINGHLLNETRMEIMGRQRFFVEVTLNRATVEACNLLGSIIPARVLQHAKDLLIGYGIKNAELPLAEEIQVHYVNLREIDVHVIEASELRRLLIATADRLLREVYCQPNASLANVLEELSEGKSSDVRIAQAEILEAAGHYLRQFGVRKSTALRKVLEEYEMAAHRRAEEQVARERGQGQLDGDQADIISQRAQDQLRKLLETDLEARNEILDGVRHKLTDNRYHARSILFELFQNADDAYAELGSDCNGVFVVEIQSDVITIMHEGRRINHPGSGGPDTAGHTRDLRKMLSLGHSDKGFGSTSVAVTGRFGLGFKSVFLFTDRPLVVSGRLTFEVLGAVYPRPLGQPEAEGIRLRLSASGMSSASGTAIRLTPRLGSDMLAVTELFHQLAHILIVFARRIRQIRYSVNSSGIEDLKWMEIEIAKRGASRVTTGTLRSAKSESGPRRVVVIRTPTGDVLFGVCSSGFTRTHQDIPTVWVTAPTCEKCNIGFVVNAAFILDVGRAQVDWTATANRITVEDLAQNLGDALLGLYEATSGNDWPTLSAALQLASETSRINLWCSFWEVISDQRTAPEILKRLFWAPRTGAATRLYTDHDALPTGLAAEGFQGLTSLTSVRFVLKGTLDQRGRESLQSEVAKWSSFQNYHRGTVVSYRLIWSMLRSLVPEGVADLESIDLEVILKAELQTEVKIDPLRATRFGNVFNPAFFKDLAEESAAGRDETVRLRVVLRAAQFRTQGGTWAPAAELLLSRANKIPDREDEVLRSGFAPADAVLSDTYSEVGTKFFYICRGEMSADAARLVQWSIVADTSERRRAVLHYLLRGEHRRELADRLSHKISNCWLGSLLQTDLLGQFSANDRIMILACLGLYVPIPSPVQVSQHSQTNPIESLRRIAEWWQNCGEDRLAMFDLALYPMGRSPKLTQTAPITDPATRREWLTLFIAGILTTSGRTKYGQIREFLRLSSDEGWLDQLTDPKNGPAEWLVSVQRFIDRQVDDIPRYHRLRQFVGIATVARYLDQYVQGFLEMDRIKSRFSLKDILTQRTCQHFQGTDLDAPPLGPILGYGACFVVRELARTGIISSNRAHRYCFPPARSLRSFLTSIGWVDNEARTEAPWTRSRSIYAFLREHVEQCPDPTFGKAFDIPLLSLAEDEVLARKVLGDAFPVR